MPRSGQLASVFGGTYTSDPTHYRYSIFRDGVQVGASIVQTTPEYHFTLVDADVNHAITATAEASFDSGSTYPISNSAIVNWTYQTDVITPSAIADGTITRTSANGALPLTFDIDALIYSSYEWEIRVENAALDTIKYIGAKAVSEAELNSPFNMDLSGATDPVPEPPIADVLPGGIAQDDVVSVRPITPDWVEMFGSGGLYHESTGLAGNWMSVSATDRAGHRRWRFTNTGASSAGLKEIRAMLSAGGANVAIGRNIYSSAPIGGNYDPHNLFDSVDQVDNIGVLTAGGWVELDFGVNVALYQMTLTSVNGITPPSDYEISYSDDGVTYTPVVTRSGLAWAANEVKTELL